LFSKQGDSGSAMSVINANGQYTQIGVTSFVSSAGCASGNPDGYVRSYIDNSFRSITCFKTKFHLSNQIGSRFQLPVLDQQHHWLGSVKTSLKKIADSAICSNRIIQLRVINVKIKVLIGKTSKFQRVVHIFVATHTGTLKNEPTGKTFFQLYIIVKYFKSYSHTLYPTE